MSGWQLQLLAAATEAGQELPQHEGANPLARRTTLPGLTSQGQETLVSFVLFVTQKRSWLARRT